MPLVFRTPRADELQRAEELVARSINDLTARHGFGPMASVRAPDFQLYCLRDDPDGLWLAEEDGEIVGFALSWLCGDLWFLAELFVASGHQGRGIGNELLARTFAHADKAGATRRALITFAFNVVSQGLYAGHGVLPRLPLYFVSASRDTLLPRLPGETLRAAPIEATSTHLATLTRLDIGALGFSREKHHRYLLADGTMNGTLLYEGAECVGYAYYSAAGHVGPVAAAQPLCMSAVFRTAMDLALRDGAVQVSALLPGASDALGVALGHGMRLTFPMVLASSREFGDWTRYLPRSPGFM